MDILVRTQVDTVDEVSEVIEKLEKMVASENHKYHLNLKAEIEVGPQLLTRCCTK